MAEKQEERDRSRDYLKAWTVVRKELELLLVGHILASEGTFPFDRETVHRAIHRRLGIEDEFSAHSMTCSYCHARIECPEDVEDLRSWQKAGFDLALALKLEFLKVIPLCVSCKEAIQRGTLRIDVVFEKLWKKSATNERIEK